MLRSPLSSSILVLGLIGLCTLMYFRLNADSISTRFVANQLDEVFRGSPFDARVGQVIFKPGAGFELTDFTITERGSRQSILKIEYVFVTLPHGATELAKLEFEPSLIEVRRAQLKLSRSDLAIDRIKEALHHFDFRDQRKSIPIRIRDSAISLHDHGREITRLNNFDLDLTPATDSSQLNLQARSNGSHFKRIAFSASVKPQSKQFELIGFNASGSLNPSVVASLPIDLRFRGNPILTASSNFSGRWECQGTAAGQFDDLTATRFALDVQVHHLSLADKNLPATLQDVSISSRISDRGIKIKRAHGQLDSGRFELAYKQSGLIHRRDWRLSGSCSNMRFSKNWMVVFPESIKKFCRHYDPGGLFDVQFTLDSSQSKQITAQLKDTSFSYYKFPYRLKNCIGDVRWFGDRLRYEVKTFENDQLLRIGGHIDNPGKYATYLCNFSTDGQLPIDEPLLKTLVNYPSISRAVRDFRPFGKVSGHGTIEKLTPGPDGKVVKQVTIKLHGCDVRHRSFDYPIQNVGGTIHVVENSFRFEDMTGVSTSGRVECSGDWNKRDGLNLVFLCNEVPFDSRLRHALAPNLKTIWDSLRPVGKIKLGKVYLNYLPGTGTPDIRVQASFGDTSHGQTNSSVSINPTWFPYEIANLHGEIHVGGGVISMSHIRGNHQTTWMTCGGEGFYNDDEWSVSLTNLLVGSVEFDHDLNKALPAELATSIKSIDFQGRFNVGGQMTFGGKHLPVTDPKQSRYPNQLVSYESLDKANTKIDWKLRFDMEQASASIGLPIKNIFGSLFLDGSYNGRIARTAGRVAFDSFTIYGAQVTNVQGPIWLDNNQTLAGKFANVSSQARSSITGNIFDGNVSFDGWLSHDEDLPFLIQATVEDAELEEAAAEIATQMQEMSGDAFGFIRLQGKSEKLHTYQGDGNVHLRNARIHQLPVVLSLLKILRVKEVNRTAFDTSDVDFSIQGDQIKLSRIELIGDAISLIGNGYLEWMRYADVNFYSVVGRNRFHIPILSDIYKAGCQRIMWINVGGPMHNLQTTRKVLPGFERLHQDFVSE